MHEHAHIDCPDVSVIVPAYNAGATLERAALSALNQEGVELELIVIDDCSEDNTLNVARALADQDVRIRVIARPSNGGISVARNDGIESARGNWVTPLDADDGFAPGRLAAMLAEAERRRVDILADNLNRCDIDLHRQGLMFENRFAGREISLDDFVASSAPGSVSLGYMKPLIRRAFLETHHLRYPHNILNVEDWYLYFLCLLKGARLFLMSEAYYDYAIHPQSSSRQRVRMVTNASHLLLAHEKAYRLAIEHGNNSVAAELASRIKRYRLFVLKQRTKKVLLDIPAVAAFVDWRKKKNNVR